MQITTLLIRNFRAVTSLDLVNLASSVVIAGPNGCGKSCVLDAIRLVKSVYGGYNPNEWQNWFGEFQINFNRHPTAVLALFQNRARPLEIQLVVTLSDQERDYLANNADRLLRDQIWQELVPDRRRWSAAGVPIAAEDRAHLPTVERRLTEAIGPFHEELRQPTYAASLRVMPNARIETARSRLLELLFSLYDSENLGIIDYHGANRNYNREQLGGINLNIESSEDRLRQHALYNYTNKYANLKSEMAASFIRHLLAKEADPSNTLDDSLTTVLKELFSTFFPGKEFIGPRPTADGRLLFNVRTPSGAEHDIDELSAGEKEVLYGYLRLRNSAPRNSVILIDEPELHLNPRLVQGLASFYQRHLGRALNNQIWLVTHSDTLIREAVGQPGFSVFHMQPAGLGEVRNQATVVSAADDLERCVIDLVGDLAAYRPGAKLVVFEGGGDADFDVKMTSQLFPKFAQLVNMISAGSKRRVTDLYDLLETARAAGHLPLHFYVITDSDIDQAQNVPPRKWRWEAYHIENYLLEPHFIKRVLDEVALKRGSYRDEREIYEGLRQCAEETINDLVRHDLRRYAGDVLVKCLDFGTDPRRDDVAVAVGEAVVSSSERVQRAIRDMLTPERLRQREDETSATARSALQGDEWRRTFRGRDVLRRFVGRCRPGVSYEIFRDLILARMSDVEFEPIEMGRVLNAILVDH